MGSRFQREVLLMGSIGDLLPDDGGGFFGGTPINDMFETVNQPAAVAQAVQDNPSKLATLSTESGTDPLVALQRAQAVTGAGKTTPATMPSYAASSPSASGAASGGVVKAVVLSGLVAGLYYVGKHRGWF